jgi:signal transduction histidine kinase
MWTAQQAREVLEKQQPMLLREWHTEVRSRLWHLDAALFEVHGTATVCVESMLSLLTDPNTLEQVYPPTHFSLFEATLAFAPASGSPHPLSSPSSHPQRQNTAAHQRFAACAEQWAELPISWLDLRTLVECFNVHLLDGLASEGADAATLSAMNGIVSQLICAAAGARAALAERERDAQREEMIATQHLTTRFLGNASHELRTPLTAVLGFAELLLEEHYGKLEPSQRTAVAHIDNSAQNLNEIINNLLDLLQIRIGKLKPHYRSLPLSGVLHNIYTILYPLSERKEVSFSIEADDSLGAIEADENIVRHIVYHVLASSLRATPKGGQVRMTARRDAEQVCIIMEDTALHLPQEALENMMNPFPRLENSPVRGYEGWEVGLPLVMRYVNLHGGKLEMISQPDRGTVFLIYLPIKPTTAA